MRYLAFLGRLLGACVGDGGGGGGPVGPITTRDEAYRRLQAQFTYYRLGDRPSQALEKIERS